MKSSIDVMYCEKCGTRVENSAEFCQNCGKSTTSTFTPSEAQEKTDTTIKCGHCDYVGVPEKARNLSSIILAWLCVFFVPLITLIYFAVTHKYRCPRCKSTFLGIKNEEGVFAAPSERNPLMILVWFLVGIAIVGIISSVILASLNSAKEKAKSSGESSYNLNNHIDQFYVL